MSDVPSNLPFADDDAPLMPPSPPVPPPAPAVPLAPPLPRPAMPPLPPVPPSVSMPPTAPLAAPSVRPDASPMRPPQDLFADIETPPSVSATPATPVNELPPPIPSEGHGKMVAIVALIVFLLAVAAGGSWFAYQSWEAKRQAVVVPVQTEESLPVKLPIVPPPAQEPSQPFDSVPLPGANPSVEVVPLPTPVLEPPLNTNVPPPTAVDPSAPVIPTASIPVPAEPSPAVDASSTASFVGFDSDGDGLTDERERELGTDPLKADTDRDTLNDGQEVQVYATNPLNDDTDGDRFQDGVEIQNGYNPRGTGRCSNVDCRL